MAFIPELRIRCPISLPRRVLYIMQPVLGGDDRCPWDMEVSGTEECEEGQ